jgi:hypothetical protein
MLMAKNCVITDNGVKITTMPSAGIAVFEWVTEEEAATVLDDGDSIDAPSPTPYKIQPDNQGCLLW